MNTTREATKGTDWGTRALFAMCDGFALLRLTGFRPKRRFAIDIGGWRVETVDTPRQLLEVLQLRSEVFLSEVSDAGAGTQRLDTDVYDLFADHVIVREPQNGRVAAAYRLLCSTDTSRFYSQEEFELDGFLAQPGIKLELGRACVRSEYRNGHSLGLVWKGLGRYARLTGARYLFGCSTVWSSDPRLAYGIVESLKPERHSDAFGVRPKERYSFAERPPRLQPLDAAASRAQLPPLLRSYLNAGALVHGEPAYDWKFRCADLFTVIDLQNTHPRVAARFLGSES